MALVILLLWRTRHAGRCAEPIMGSCNLLLLGKWIIMSRKIARGSVTEARDGKCCSLYGWFNSYFRVSDIMRLNGHRIGRR